MKLLDTCFICGSNSVPYRPGSGRLQGLDLFKSFGTAACCGSLREQMDEDGEGALYLARTAARGIRGIPANCALLMASNFGPAATLAWSWQERLDTADISDDTYAPANDYIRKMAAELGCSAGAYQISMSCASGLAVLSVAKDLLESGQADAVLALAYDEYSGSQEVGLKILRTISPEGRVMPFDLRRHGTVFGDGAAAALLVRDDAPGQALAYITGVATNNNAFHLTAPRAEAEGSRLVMAAALNDAGLAPSQVAHVTAHATGTVANDVTEAAAIRNLLGDSVERVSLAAYKRAIGHKLGAAGLMELILTCDALMAGKCMPLQREDYLPDEKCAPVCYNKNTNCRGPALLDAAGIGGNNAAAVLDMKPGAPTKRQGNEVFLLNMAWVLPGHIGTGLELAEHPEWLDNTDNAGLADFNPKQYLSSVRGYMDPASAYLLAACRLALGETSYTEPNPRAGFVGLTQFGCSVSAFKFHAQVQEKGEHASPLLFPHTYANTPSCLAAMENGLAGPHNLFFGQQDASATFTFAISRLQDTSADEMLLAFFEAFNPDAFPSSIHARSGAVVFRLTAKPQAQPLGTLRPGSPRTIADILRLIAKE